jgi:endonuclease/exonuclease/phosphatase family metal-dependent hydrolase
VVASATVRCVRLVVGTCNVHGGVALSGGSIDLGSVLGQLAADVLVLPEVWCPAGRDRPALPSTELHVWWQPFGRGWRWTERRPPTRGCRRPPVVLDGPPSRPFGRAPREPGAEPGTVGLVLASRWPAQQVERWDLGRLPRDRVQRWALRVELATPVGALGVVGVHLAHLSQGSPLQFRRLRTLLADLDAPALVVGDFNLFGPLVERLLPGHRRAIRARSWPARRPLAQPDHVLVPRDGPWQPEATAVLAPLGSDHRPLRVVLRRRPFP